MSKYSVEAVSDTLRHEMIKWGVKVVIIEPGNFGGKFFIFKGPFQDPSMLFLLHSSVDIHKSDLHNITSDWQPLLGVIHLRYT